MTARIMFSRVVVGFHQGTPDRAVTRTAAEFARMLHVSLAGLFVEDPRVLGLAAMPGAREFQILGRCWRPLDPQGLARAAELNALSARRMLDETARRLGIPASFEIVRDPVEKATIVSVLTGDIVVVAEPDNPAERAMSRFPELVRAAVRSAANVLFLPRRIGRTHGPVVAIATSPDDPSIAAGSAIAAAARERLIVIETFDAVGGRETGEEPAGAARLHVDPNALADLGALSRAIEGLGERLIVVTHGAFGEDMELAPAELASRAAVPVLLVEPEPDGVSE